MDSSEPITELHPYAIRQNLMPKKSQGQCRQRFAKKRLVSLWLVFLSSIVLSPGVLAAKNANHDEATQQVCLSPKVLIDVETPQGATKTLCVNTKMADWLWTKTSVNYASPPAVHDNQRNGHDNQRSRDDDIRKICPLPKEIINIETPHGKIQTLCVKGKVADKLLTHASVTQPPLPAAVGTNLIITDLAKELMGGVANSVGSSAGGAGMGWVLGALGFTDGSDDANEILGEISGELEAIGQTLAQMKEEVKNIDESIRIQTCSNFISDTLGARGLIDALSEDYQVFLTVAGGGFVPPLRDCINSGTGVCVEDWAAAVTDNTSQTRGIANAIAQIHNSMITLSSNDGIIASCLNAKVLPLPVAGEDDSNYYNSVSSLMDAFYNYQARALLLLVEAYNYYAWVAAEEPGGDPVSDPTITSDLCIEPPNGAVNIACQQTVSWLDRVHTNLVKQFTMGGVRYTDEAVRIHYRDDPAPPLLFVRSLEHFNLEAFLQGDPSAYCPWPAVSSAPCGITVGTQQDGTAPFGLTYEYQDGWRPVFALEFGSLLRYAGNQTPASFLEDAGFHTPQGKLIIHRNTFQSEIRVFDQFKWSQALKSTVTCFTDLDVPPSFAVQPVCSQAALAPFSTGTRNHPNGNGKLILVENPDIPTLGARNGFYSFYSSNINLTSPAFVVSPGWDTATQSQEKAHQYFWPMLSLNENEISCTKGRSLTNVAGAYTRCGDDLDVWLAQHVPGPTVNNGRQPTYHYIGQQPTSLYPGWVDETGTQLTDGLLPPVNEGELDDRWVVFREVGIPQPSVAFDFGKKTDVGLISVTYLDQSETSLGPDRVEIFTSEDGGLNYSAEPAVVYNSFMRDSNDPDVHTYTDFIPVNIKGADTIRMDFYQGEASLDHVHLGEVSFFE